MYNKENDKEKDMKKDNKVFYIELKKQEDGKFVVVKKGKFIKKEKEPVQE